MKNTFKALFYKGFIYQCTLSVTSYVTYSINILFIYQQYTHKNFIYKWLKKTSNTSNTLPKMRQPQGF